MKTWRSETNTKLQFDEDRVWIIFGNLGNGKWIIKSLIIIQKINHDKKSELAVYKKARIVVEFF